IGLVAIFYYAHDVIAGHQAERGREGQTSALTPVNQHRPLHVAAHIELAESRAQRCHLPWNRLALVDSQFTPVLSDNHLIGFESLIEAAKSVEADCDVDCILLRGNGRIGTAEVIERALDISRCEDGHTFGK